MRNSTTLLLIGMGLLGCAALRIVSDDAYTKELHANCIVFGHDDRAVSALRLCSAQGDVRSTLRLAEMLKDRGAVKEADALFRSVLDRPNGEGEYLIAEHGTMMKDGIVYGHGREAELAWLRKAQAKGVEIPASRLAPLLVSTSRFEEAGPVLDRIAKQDLVAAARLAEKMPNSSRWIRPAAESGDALSQYRLAQLFRSGGGGLSRDVAAYERWTMNTASSQDAWIYSILEAAHLLEDGGITVTRDRVAALAMYRRALPRIDSSDGGGRRQIEEKIAALERL